LVTVYRDPISLVDEEKCVASAKLRGNFAFDRVSIANFDGTKVHDVDEVRIGTSFSAVTTGQQNTIRKPLADSVSTSDWQLLFKPADLLTQSIRPTLPNGQPRALVESPTL
jgi:hypothetical protein